MIDSFEGEFAFLSNFFPSPITFDGITFPTVENWFQAWKTEVPAEFRAIATAETPGRAKRLGRKCMLREDWEEVKEQVMEDGLRLKFADPELKAKLLATGNQYLEEGNTWHDNYWGVCHCIDCQDIMGKNHLGKLLMKLRTEFMEEK